DAEASAFTEMHRGFPRAKVARGWRRHGPHHQAFERRHGGTGAGGDAQTGRQTFRFSRWRPSREPTPASAGAREPTPTGGGADESASAERSARRRSARQFTGGNVRAHGRRG